MDFISNKSPQIIEMLKEIGITNIEELFANIPAKLRLPSLDVDDGLSEYEGLQLMEQLAAKNSFAQLHSYLGAGAYEHHVPALVGAICGKSEFLTSYTPYQAEASQGMLQAIFEYQSAICALTDMDVTNASLYDGASACGEAVLMALRINKDRNKVLIADSLHPHYRATVDLYTRCHNLQIEVIPRNENGQIDQITLMKQLDANTAAVLIQSPNFLGIMEEVEGFSKAIHEVGALLLLCANPLSYGIYASAGELGADIAIGDTQPFGLSMSYGGPYAGYMACKEVYLRQMPGRLVGETTDHQGKQGFVLTLQAREQHIRREKATSNICTNQSLAALASLISLLWYGPEGIHQLALTNFQRASYLKQGLMAISGAKVYSSAPMFNEFAIDFGVPAEEVLNHFRAHGIEAGISLGGWYSDLRNHLLVAVTETKDKSQLDQYIHTASLLRGNS